MEDISKLFQDYPLKIDQDKKLSQLKKNIINMLSMDFDFQLEKLINLLHLGKNKYSRFPNLVVKYLP